MLLAGRCVSGLLAVTTRAILTTAVPAGQRGDARTTTSARYDWATIGEIPGVFGGAELGWADD